MNGAAHRLLLVEDEDVIRRALTRFLERKGFEVTGAATVEAAAREPLDAFDVLLVDVRLPGADGTELIALAEPVPVVVMTSHASVRAAVEAMRRGAIDYVAKPFDHDELLRVLERAVRHHRRDAQNRALRDELARERALHRLLEGTSLERLVAAAADSPALRPGDSPAARAPRVFVHGEPGSGREAVARGLHERLRTADVPFVVVDAPALDPAARTAARLVPRARDARHGTLVLRHPELLTGDARGDLVDACVGADAMLVEIAAAAPDGSGPDVVVAVPPLRLRRDDALLLAHRAVARVAARHARARLALAPEAGAWVRARDWPGNVTELDQVVQRAAAGSAGDAVGVAALAAAASAGTAGAAGASAAHALSLEEYFRWFVLTHQGELSETALAARLGISRKALWERRQRMGLARDPGPDGP